MIDFNLRNNCHAARDLVTSNVLVGFGIDGRLLSVHEGVRKYLSPNQDDNLNRNRSASAVYLLICRSGPTRVVLKLAQTNS